MPNALEKLKRLGELIGSLRRAESVVSENPRTVSVQGAGLDQHVHTVLAEIMTLSIDLSSPARITLDNEAWDDVGLDEVMGATWELQLGKLRLSEVCPESTDYEITYLFFYADQFLTWSEGIQPFSNTEIDATKSTRIFVRSLGGSFGSQKLAVLPWFENASTNASSSAVPDRDSVHELIHTIGPSPLFVSPVFYALTWGKIDGASARGFLKCSIETLAVCLSQELRFDGTRYQVVLRGLRKIEPYLSSRVEASYTRELNDVLRKIVVWIFEERRETRHKLLIDRVTLDYESGLDYIQCLGRTAERAWEQAKDSYGFVILERKDAYQKELREFMKDVRTQADLFASKIRELISGLSRDLIAVLLVIAVSVLGKVDIGTIGTPAVQVFFKILAGYLVFSCILQLVAHHRDAFLAYDETSNWLRVLRNYSSAVELDERFTKPIKKRRFTFQVASGIVAAIYAAIAAVLWNAPSVVAHFVPR